mmetsp:Transcript_34327/g.94601  ORF Transcript_34327/g.94601 Transcript_34327/m.94601 type:complete len:136 (-) Transcript_34327:398-805(-)
MLFALAAALSAANAWQCPAYSDIRHRSVDAKNFDINEISGVWYLVATTEPTTRFCLCNVMNYSIFTSTYRLRGVLALRRDAALWRRCCCEEPSRVAASTADAVARSTLLASPDAEAHTLPTTEPRTGTRTRAIKI